MPKTESGSPIGRDASAYNFGRKEVIETALERSYDGRNTENYLFNRLFFMSDRRKYVASPTVCVAKRAKRPQSLTKYGFNIL